MCKICKACGKSNFGVTLKRAEERAARMVNGEIKEYFEGSEEIKEEISINYCFTCGSEIIEADLIETYICKVCKSSVKQVNENGVCSKCAEEVDSLSKVSREDLILMILKQNKKISYEAFDSSKENEIASENKEKLVKNNRKSGTIKRGYKTAKNSDHCKVEIDNSKKISSKRKTECKPKDEINNTKKENKEIASISQENMDKAINDNKEKIKSAPKIKSADIKSLDYVTDKVTSPIDDVLDIFMVEDIKEDINNINTEVIDADVVHNTLMEIEDIMYNKSSFN